MQWKVFSQRIEKQPNEWSTYNFHTAAAFPHILPSHLWLFIWSHLIYSNAAASHTLCARSTTTNMGGLLKHLCEEQKLRRESEALKEEEAAAPEIYYYWAGIISSKKRLQRERAARKIMPPTKIKTFAAIVQAHLPHLLHSRFPRELFQCLMRANFNC